MDGYEASEEIRSHINEVKNPMVLIIAMTANALKGDREKCIQSGMDDYISKPVTPKSVAEVLNKWISKLITSDGVSSGVVIQDPISLFSAEKLEEDFDGDRDTIREVLRMFLDTARGDLNDLSDAIRGQDHIRVKILARTLKGSAWNVGAGSLEESAARLEKLSSSGDLANADVLFKVMESEYDKLVAHLAEMEYR